jgi:hypothetical protein
MLRFTVDQWEAAIEGSPADLRRLADNLDARDSVVVVELSAPEGVALLRRQLTDDDRLRITVGPGPNLLVEGTASAIEIVSETMRGVAEAAQQVGRDAVQRHAHIEYLGEDDQWRAPDSFPLVVTSEWPDAASE